jgi:outer membrane receptor protein involved in Fe transport
VQLHLQDQWRIMPKLTLQAGFKSSLQYANGRVLIQPILGSLPGVTAYPTGQINTKNWFLPQIGARWDVTPSEQIFLNAQKNLRELTTTGGLSLWLLGSQPIFDALRSVVKPETAWTYEVGIRTRRSLNWGPLTSIEGQINYYHVDFSDRLLAVNAAPTGSIVGGASIIQNVGDVKTDGVDAALTLRFGRTFSLYNALSYNRSIYQGDYQSGTSIIPTAGKNVPASPSWLNTTVATLNVAGFELQAIGDYVGKRYATYTNDQSVPGYFLLSARLGFDVPLPSGIFAKTANISLNVTNITQNRGTSSVSVAGPTGVYATFPQAPRQWFLTLAMGF